MRTIEFFRKFLPGFAGKYEDYLQGKYHDYESFKDHNLFPAIQHFAARLCEKQRQNCMQAYAQANNDKMDAILNAPSPQIDEL